MFTVDVKQQYNNNTTTVLERKDDKSFKRDTIALISFLILFVTISFLVNIGTEMSLPGFRTPFTSYSCDNNHQRII